MKCEIAVVGGGPVGATTAIALSTAGFSVVLIEPKSRSPKADGEFEPRVSAITRASEQVMRALRVWPYLNAARLGVFSDMHVWEHVGRSEIHFDSAEIGESHLGHIIENRELEHALSLALAEAPGLTELRGEKLNNLSINANGAQLTLGSRQLRAELVVGADGSNSYVRECVGIRVKQADYEQRAVVAVVTIADGHSSTAWQRFVSGGTIAVLPLPGRQACLVWSAPISVADALLQLGDAEFLQMLESETESRLGRFLAVGARGWFPLRSLQADDYVLERVALVGDAAHTIHPLAGQGVNLGVYDAAALAQVLEAARDKGRSISSHQTLRRYERWRRGHNVAMGLTMDGFFKLFSHPATTVISARGFGLGMVDRLAPLKNSIMSFASGLSGDLPGLARRNAADRSSVA